MLEQPARMNGGCAGVQVWSAFFLPNAFHVSMPQKNEEEHFLPNPLLHKS